MKAQAATMTVSLEEMEAELQTIQKERVRIEEKLDLSRKQKDEKIAAQLPLKQKLAAGDKSASVALDRLDAEIRDLVRVEEVLRQAEASIAPKIVAQQAHVNQLRRDLAEEESQCRFVAAKDAVTALRDKVLSQHAEMTKTAAELCVAQVELTEFGVAGLQAIEAIVIKSPLNNPVHALQMAGWAVPWNAAGVRDLTVRPMLPPAKPVSPSVVTQFERGQGPGNDWNRNFRPRS
jgi:hypothetical protein